MNNKNVRAMSNLAMIEFVARKFGPLNKEVVYLGGATTGLFITDPASLDVRPKKRRNYFQAWFRLDPKRSLGTWWPVYHCVGSRLFKY